MVKRIKPMPNRPSPRFVPPTPCLVTLALCFLLNFHMHASPPTSAQEQAAPLRVLRSDPLVHIRSRFREDTDLVISTRLGSNRQITFFRTFLVPRSAGMTPEELSTGIMIHQAGDDATPWSLNGTYIGGNHGCSDVVEIQSPQHGLGTADIGSEWKDAEGISFFVVRIADQDTLWLLSENHGDHPIWKFTTQISGNRITEGIGMEPRSLEVEAQKQTQLVPALRLLRQEFLADGHRPLPEGQPVECEFLDLVEEQEIINPGAVLAAIRSRPGVDPDFVAGGLAAVMRNRIVYRFHPDGSTVIDTRSKALQEFEMGSMGFVQSAKLNTGDFDTHEYLVPGTVPFEIGGNRYDFSALQDYRQPLAQPVVFSEQAGNLLDPKKPPARFLQFLGKMEGTEIRREVGYALGYSPLEGLTTAERRPESVRVAAWLHTTNKSYPHAVDRKLFGNVPAGTEFHCLAYRQYFDPSIAGPALACYWNRQDGKILVFADFLQTGEHIRLPLPGFLAGREFSILEQSPCVTVHGAGRIPQSGLKVSAHRAPGFLIIAVVAEDR